MECEMTRRVLAGWACVLYVALDVALYILARTAGASLNEHTSAGSQAGVLAIDVVLVLAARRRPWAWTVLLVLNVAVLVATAVAVVSWTLYAGVLVTLVVAQVAVLLAGRRPERERLGRDGPWCSPLTGISPSRRSSSATWRSSRRWPTGPGSSCWLTGTVIRPGCRSAARLGGC
jgi:hypothetical protein